MAVDSIPASQSNTSSFPQPPDLQCPLLPQPAGTPPDAMPHATPEQLPHAMFKYILSAFYKKQKATWVLQLPQSYYKTSSVLKLFFRMNIG